VILSALVIEPTAFNTRIAFQLASITPIFWQSALVISFKYFYLLDNKNLQKLLLGKKVCASTENILSKQYFFYASN